MTVLCVLYVVVHMSLFSFNLVDGIPIHEQIREAAQRMILTGELKEGDAFPSVREISQLLQVNPNTVQKAVSSLKVEGFLKAYPGLGMKVTLPERMDESLGLPLLADDIRRLVVKSKKLGVGLPALLNQIKKEEGKYE